MLATAPHVIEDTKPGVTGTSLPLGTRVEVYPSTPLPEFNAAGGPAFAARYRNDAGSDLVAIICNTGLPARFELVNSMRSIDHPSVMRIVDSGVVTWPDGSHFAAIAYQRPLSPRYMLSLDETHPLLNEDVANRRFIQPLIGALSEFMRTGIFHGAIRPTNLFWRAGNAMAPMLGECLSAPPGVRQPALFETIERGMAQPMGRGAGSHEDDCYALGVTIALFILGHNPLKGLDDAAVLRAKMDHGTFNTLVGHHRLSPLHIELLRGLLADDAHQRWTAADLEQWLSGRRLTPKSSDTGRRSSRHFDFGGKEYWQVRPLAAAFAANVQQAAQMIESGALDKWLRRSLGDEDRAENVVRALKSVKEHGKTSNLEDQLTSRVCMALDPTAPIRYRGLSVLPSGIASVLAETVANGTSVEVIADIISSQLVSLWTEMQKNKKAELLPLVQLFVERLAGTIEKTSYGNGVERTLYELNPTLPCMSPMLRPYCVMTPKSLLPALERVAGGSSRGREPMDRHIAAFLIVRDRRNEILFESMSAPEGTPRRGVAMLTLYSDMQLRHGPDRLPHLAQWLSPFLEAATRRFFGKALRDSTQRQIKDLAERGDLGALTRLVDNPHRLERDEQEFIAARLLYLNILKEVNVLEGRMADRDAIVQKIGKPAAASISCLVALFAILFVLARAIWTSM